MHRLTVVRRQRDLGGRQFSSGREAVQIRAIHIDPKHAVGHYYLGRALQRKGELDEAIKAFSKAIDLDPRLVPAYSYRGSVLARPTRSGTTSRSPPS